MRQFKKNIVLLTITINSHKSNVLDAYNKPCPIQVKGDIAGFPMKYMKKFLSVHCSNGCQSISLSCFSDGVPQFLSIPSRVKWDKQLY